MVIASLISFRYKIIKDSSKLSGRGSDQQWPYYEVMDDLLARDPSVVPIAIESSLTIG